MRCTWGGVGRLGKGLGMLRGGGGAVGGVIFLVGEVEIRSDIEVFR